jgi:hypothetical protein
VLLFMDLSLFALCLLVRDDFKNVFVIFYFFKVFVEIDCLSFLLSLFFFFFFISKAFTICNLFKFLPELYFSHSLHLFFFSLCI